MTDPSTKAREIYDNLEDSNYLHYDAEMRVYFIDLIAAVLQEWGEAEYLRGQGDFKFSAQEIGKAEKIANAEGYRRGRVDEAKKCNVHAKLEYRRGIEEAAKIANELFGGFPKIGGWLYRGDVSKAIRALLPSEGKGKRNE